jgi:L-aspartate oxidase
MQGSRDVLIIGCGIAGASAALRLAEESALRIAVLAQASDPTESATRHAQGGIVGRGPDDSADLLVEDILRAGAGLSSSEAARQLAERGPALVDSVLVDALGVPLSKTDNGEAEFAREGAHSVPRVLHYRDETGRVIQERLIAALRDRPNVELLTGRTAVDLITVPHHSTDPRAVYRPVSCCGAYVLHQDTAEIEPVFATATILATGGLGRIFRHTSNPDGARGDGFAMAYRAGARLINLEYVQFHPTTLAVRGAGNFLVSEAVRGAGGQLLTPDGDRFMERHEPEWGDLAPRDVVSRAMHHEMTEHGYRYLLLDLRPALDADRIEAEFPTIYAACREAGIDPTSEAIPVVPAAHYACGGVLVDGRARTSIERLYAVGEVSCTGVHGANRLASTSLLEGLVWGTAAAEDIAERMDLEPHGTAEIASWETTGDEPADPVLVLRDLEMVQNIMWHYVGLSRSGDRLARAAEDLAHQWRGIDNFYRTRRLDDRLIGLRNAAQCAWITCLAARRNRTSRGTHWREDGE